MVSDFEIKTLPAQPALMRRTHTSVKQLGQVLRPGLDAVIQYLDALGEQPAGPFFAAYYNDDMQNLDVGIGLVVSHALPGKGDIQAGEIPAGSYAACLYTGPYAHLSEAYTALREWVKDKGRHTTPVAYEMYLDDASKTPSGQLRTIVMQPLHE